MLSIVVVNWNTASFLRKCLASLEKHPASESVQTIVVDNASQDDSAGIVSREFPGVRLIQPGSNTGYAQGNNLGIAVAEGEWILTLNPDTEFEDDTLDRAIARLKGLPSHGCLAVRLVGPDGETQASVRGFPDLVGILGDVTGLGRRFPGTRLDGYRLTAFDYDVEHDAPQPMGSFLLFRGEALAAVGDPRSPFDETFPIFFNEVDLLKRLSDAGWKTRYCPDLHVLHHGGMGTRQVRKSMIWESHRSLVRYLLKHITGPGNRLAVRLVAGLIYAAAFVRARGYHAGF